MATQLVSKPLEPSDETDEHAVVRFRKYNGNYSFAAININGAWYLTQDGSRSARQGYAPLDWDGLLYFVGERNWSTLELLG